MRIEPYEHDGEWGVVRRPEWPAMIGFRPELWRFERLDRILDNARAIAELTLGPGEGAALIAAIAEIHDVKGDFSVGWRHAKSRLDYEEILDRALAEEGEDDILHFDAVAQGG